MNGWRDPAIVVAVTVLGVWILPGLCALARKARSLPRRRRGAGATSARCLRPLTPTELIARGQVARWDDATVARVKDALR
jgi:hypothetical protein